MQEKWGSDLEFWMTSLGTAVGYGSIWRFPYLIHKNGGGAFLIPYTLILVLFGIPQYYLEFSIGLYFREVNLLLTQNMIKIYEKPGLKFKGIPIAFLIIGIFFSTYYIYLLAYTGLYFYHSCSFTVPWHTLDHTQLLNSTRNFYYQKVLNYDIGENKNDIHWPLFFSFICSWLVVFFCLRKGVELTGKIAIFTVLAPYFLMVVFLIR